MAKKWQTGKGIHFCGITHATELHEIECNITAQNYWTVPMTDISIDSVLQYKMKERPGNTDPHSQKDKDYDIIRPSRSLELVPWKRWTESKRYEPTEKGLIILDFKLLDNTGLA